MATIEKSTQDQWFIAMNQAANVFHSGYLAPGQEMETGQPNIEVFQTEADWEQRKAELNINESNPE
ncbi:MAG: hypothetical protein N4A41_05440 [Crocinitomicaceae bacterium]|jgi:hypothetical protein|nr:hypothetical protein [Crocinitomicaceae bacterium]